MGVLKGFLLVLVLSACAAQTDAPSATVFIPTPAPAVEVSLGDGTPARAWGDGPYGVVLIGQGWAERDIPAELAGHGMRAVVPSSVSTDALRDAITWLHDQGVDRVAVLAVGEGVAAAFELGGSEPALVDQLIVVSGSGDVAQLGPFPKLFVAGEGEALAAEATRMAAEAPGDWNAELLLPYPGTGVEIVQDPASGVIAEGILRRLAERR